MTINLIEDDEPRTTVYGAMMVLTARLLIDDDNEPTGVVARHYISKKEAQRRINILKTYPQNAMYTSEIFNEIFMDG